MTRTFPPVSARVLLVDDDKNVTEGLSLLLHASKYDVLVAHSAAEALAIMRRRVPDVVVSDEQMPGMCGSMFLSIVAKEFPDTARIILTGKASVETAVRAINEGKISRFLQKPCPRSEFLAAIADALRSSTISRSALRLLDVVRSENQRIPAFGASSSNAVESRDDRSQELSGGFSLDELATLSVREREVLELLVDGLRVSQVAKALFVSKHTVRNHLKALFRKLNVHSQPELLIKGRRTL